MTKRENKASVPREATRESAPLTQFVPEGLFVPKASDVLADRLREVILSSGLAEGTPIPTERELVAQSGLSRSSVREALRVLETEGLVTTKVGRNGGTRVRRPDRRSISRTFELFVRSHGVRLEALLEAREAIEPAAARLAAIHRTDEDLAEMTRVNRLYENGSNDVDEHVRLNLQWHRAIVRASRNELLIAFFDAIGDSLKAATEAQALNSADLHRDVARAHGRVVAAIAAGDADAAFRRMQRHVSAYITVVNALAAKEKNNNGRANGRNVAARRKR
jgi:GntR family transcriptional regulator, transcriptional repressor for pyruvate dehydrogenase complex